MPNLERYWKESIRNYKSPEEIVSADPSRNIRSFNSYYPVESVKFFADKLSECIDTFAVKNSFQGPGAERQVLVLWRELVLEYPTLKWSDICLVFRWAILGKFGQNYNRLDVPVILDWFTQYMDYRDRVHMEVLHARHEQQKSGEIRENTVDKAGLLRLAKIFGSVADKMRKSNAQDTLEHRPLRAQSIEQWCAYNGYDPGAYMKEFDRQFKDEYDSKYKATGLDYDKAYRYAYSLHLNQLNECKITKKS